MPRSSPRSGASACRTPRPTSPSSRSPPARATRSSGSTRSPTSSRLACGSRSSPTANDPTAAADAARKARAEGAVTQVEALLNRDPDPGQAGPRGQPGRPRPAGLRPTRQPPPAHAGGDQTDEAIQRAAAGQPVAGGPVMHTPPAGGSPLISDADNLAAEKRLSAGTGTDADRALRATYLQQQNTPPAAAPLQVAAGPAANGLPQVGPMPPARGDGGPAPSATAGQRRSRPIRLGARRCRPPISRSSTRSRSATRRRTGPMSAPPSGRALQDHQRPRRRRRATTLPGGQPSSRASRAAAATPVTSPRHADFVSGQQLKAAEAAAQIRDRKPTLSDADKAADAADQQLLDRYKASHGIPRTTGIDMARLPDDPPQAVRDTSPEPVPHPDTHVLPSHPTSPRASRVRASAPLPAPVPGGPARRSSPQIGAPARHLGQLSRPHEADRERQRVAAWAPSAPRVPPGLPVHARHGAAAWGWSIPTTSRHRPTPRRAWRPRTRSP